ncbi:MAG: hypothetical protein AAFO58_11750 [Pseudomonadota bacterium]
MAQTQSTACAEIVSFRLIDGADPAAFLDAAAATRAVLEAFGGCRARYLTRGDDGTWTDIVIWTDRATALAAAQHVVKDPAFAPFGAMIDGPSVTMGHADILWQMG